MKSYRQQLVTDTERKRHTQTQGERKRDRDTGKTREMERDNVPYTQGKGRKTEENSAEYTKQTQSIGRGQWSSFTCTHGHQS